MGVSPEKVWIERVGPLLKANTRNNPQCFVEWGWHVAPTICVRRSHFWFLWSQEMVVDPALFTTPVSKAAWKSVQNNPNATLTDTDWEIFWLWGMGTDPAFAQTQPGVGRLSPATAATLAVVRRSPTVRELPVTRL